MIIHYLPIYIYFECILCLLLLKFSKKLMFWHPEISLASLWWSKIFLLPYKPISTITGNYQTLARLQLLLVMVQLFCNHSYFMWYLFYLTASTTRKSENPKIYIGRTSAKFLVELAIVTLTYDMITYVFTYISLYYFLLINVIIHDVFT